MGCCNATDQPAASFQRFSNLPGNKDPARHDHSSRDRSNPIDDLLAAFPTAASSGGGGGGERAALPESWRRDNPIENWEGCTVSEDGQQLAELVIRCNRSDAHSGSGGGDVQAAATMPVMSADFTNTLCNTAALPRSLTKLIIENARCAGDFDMQHLPRHLAVLELRNLTLGAVFHPEDRLEFPPELTRLVIAECPGMRIAPAQEFWTLLPAQLVALDISSPLLAQNVELHELPQHLRVLKVLHITGPTTISLGELPAHLEELELASVVDEGDCAIRLATQRLPRSLRSFSLKYFDNLTGPDAGELDPRGLPCPLRVTRVDTFGDGSVREEIISP